MARLKVDQFILINVSICNLSFCYSSLLIELQHFPQIIVSVLVIPCLLTACLPRSILHSPLPCSVTQKLVPFSQASAEVSSTR